MTTIASPAAGNTRKVYATGSDPSIRVPMREISLTSGERHVVYDTSGPYTDPDSGTDVHRGLDPLRLRWIIDRGDTEELEKPTSLYRRGRDAMHELDEVRFAASRKPRVAKPGANVTQMHYARAGIVTPEMEFIAIREGLSPAVRAR